MLNSSPNTWLPLLSVPASAFAFGLALTVTAPLVLAEPTIEWQLHRNADGTHPDGNEQEMLWLMNRARQNPAEEGRRLAVSSDPDIADAIDYFNVDLEVLQAEFNGYAAKPPAAFDARLYEAALVHTHDQIARDTSDHLHHFDRIDDQGFQYRRVRGNVFSYVDSALYAHAGFNINWGGGDGTGMQEGRGHRQALMSLDGAYTNVGISFVAENNPATNVGPFVVVGNYAEARENGTDHFNRFLVGTVWQDMDGDGDFDGGEGISGITVRPDRGTYYAITSAGGGYAIPIMAEGRYFVSFTGEGVPAATLQTQVGASSILLDYRIDGMPETPTTDLFAALLPSSRSVQVGTWATVFATVINNTASQASDCIIEAPADFAGDFLFNMTDPATNALIGRPMEPAGIATGAAQSVLIALRPSAPIEPTDLFFTYSCRGLSPAVAIRGLTTLQFSASSDPTADLIALATTRNNDGIVSIQGDAGVAAFAVSAVNLGITANILVSADTGSAMPPVDLQICATDPPSGACLAPPANSVTIPIETEATPTFSIFVSAIAPVAFDPAVNRIFVRFTDHDGIIRGSTSVAVRTN